MLKVVPKDQPEGFSQAEWDEGFDEHFWPAYPRKVARYVSKQEWSRIKPRTQETFDWILAGLAFHTKLWIEEGREPSVIPHARTFLHQRRWEDIEP